MSLNGKGRMGIMPTAAVGLRGLGWYASRVYVEERASSRHSDRPWRRVVMQRLGGGVKKAVTRGRCRRRVIIVVMVEASRSAGVFIVAWFVLFFLFSLKLRLLDNRQCCL
jgi:hypothetical protein